MCDRTKSFVFVLIIIAVVAVSSSIARASSIALSPDRSSLQLGETLTIDLIAGIDSMEEIIGFGFDLHLSGTGALTFDGFVPNRPLFGDDRVYLASISDADGIRGASEGNLLSGPAVSGNNVLLGTLLFTSSGFGDVLIGLGADDLDGFATEGLIPPSGPNFMPAVSTTQVNVVPIPHAMLLLGSGLIGLVGFNRRAKRR